MGRYVKNADLTVEYLVKRAFRLGAQSIYSDIRPDCSHALVIEWTENSIHSYGMLPRVVTGANVDFSNQLPVLRQSIENSGSFLRLWRGQSDEDRLERQAQAHLESAALHRDDPIVF